MSARQAKHAHMISCKAMRVTYMRTHTSTCGSHTLPWQRCAHMRLVHAGHAGPGREASQAGRKCPQGEAQRCAGLTHVHNPDPAGPGWRALPCFGRLAKPHSTPKLQHDLHTTHLHTW